MAPQNFVSVTRRPPDVEDYIDMLRRYRSWIIAPMFAGLVISVVVAFLWPDTYRSQATMQITPQAVSERLVPSEITSQMGERLMQMETEILSTHSLSALILDPQLDLYKKERQQKPLEDVVQDMRNKAISIKMMAPPGGDPARRNVSAFQIAFDYTDKYKATMVVQKLVNKFMDANVNVLKNSAQQTRTFIEDELTGAQQRMDSLSAALTKFKVEHNGHLPEQAVANMQMVNSLQQQAATESEAVSRSTNQKMLLESQLTSLQNEVTYYSSHAEDTVTSGAQGIANVKNQRLIALDQELSKAQSDLSEALKMYRENYPPIGLLKARIENLQKQKDDLEKQEAAKEAAAANANTAQPTSVKVTNPQVAAHIEDLKASINLVKTNITVTQVDIQNRQNRLAELNRRIAEYQQRIETSPLNEQEYARLQGDLNLAKQQYDDMKKKKEVSATVQNLEDHKAGENLGVLDAASVPEASIEPNRPQWVGIGTVAGLMLGILLAGAKEMKNTSLKNLKDVRAYTNLPILSSVPLLENALLVRRKRRLFWLAWSSAFIIGSIAMSGAMYYHFVGRG